MPKHPKVQRYEELASNWIEVDAIIESIEDTPYRNQLDDCLDELESIQMDIEDEQEMIKEEVLEISPETVNELTMDVDEMKG